MEHRHQHHHRSASDHSNIGGNPTKTLHHLTHTDQTTFLLQQECQDSETEQNSCTSSRWQRMLRALMWMILRFFLAGVLFRPSFTSACGPALLSTSPEQRRRSFRWRWILWRIEISHDVFFRALRRCKN